MARPTRSVADHPPARVVEKSEGEERGNEGLVVDMPDRKEERGRVHGEWRQQNQRRFLHSFSGLPVVLHPRT